MEIQHYATWWEVLADEIGDRDALIHGDLHRTWAEYDDRAARVASAFTGAGATIGSKVALYLYNGPEYLEANAAALKMRAAAVNVNYRYLDDELAYLLTDSEAEVLVYHQSLGDRVARVVDRLPGLRLLVEVDDGPPAGGAVEVPGARGFDALVAGHDPLPRVERPASDPVMLYTGGTTGMPKGVVTSVGAQIDGLMATSLASVGASMPETPAELLATVARIDEANGRLVSIPACPLMHGTGLWLGAMIPLLGGGAVVTLEGRSFDGDELWDAVAREGVTQMAIVGDAFARPMLRSLEAARDAGRPHDTSSMARLVSSGAMLSAESRRSLIDLIPQLLIIDVLGSTETGIGVQMVMAGHEPETGVFTPMPSTKVVSELGVPVVPGSGEIGLIAVAQPTTQGYFKDEAKTAALLREFDGARYAVTGDMATVDADGSIRLLGRGSQCINTGGEKVYPEEVEEAVKRTGGVDDCLVVGVPDDRFGERVVAVVASSADPPPTEADVITSVRSQLSAFKAPKQVIVVPEVPRAPNGKADYKRAKALATDG